MNRLLLVPLLALSLAGCGTFGQKFEQAFTTLTSATVSSQTIVVGIQSFDAVKIAATGYLRLARCTGTNGPACRDPGVTAKLIPAIDQGTVVRNGLKSWLKANPNGLADQSAYDKLTAATSAIQALIPLFTTLKQ